ncbi:50S ribosomal protein L29 [Candidatus Woesearchaeota archaeon]|nr:50S ribosomal protein L29 [Candidatus Woesearchaeota archaeon]
MSLIKKNEFRLMTEQQLHGKLLDIERELLKLNGQRAMRTTLENPGKVKLIRKTRARILTRLNEIKRQPQRPKETPRPKESKPATAYASKPKTLGKETGGRNQRHE